jgi:hypothetical protein
MYLFRRELELVKPVCDYFKGQVVKREVRIGRCRADIVVFNGDVVTAVELKIQGWKKAIIQAKNYQLGADFVYLAFPLTKSFNVLRKAKVTLEREGIGVLIVNEKTCRVYKILEARQSRRKIWTLKNWV